jgi:hypothetical protein
MFKEGDRVEKVSEKWVGDLWVKSPTGKLGTVVNVRQDKWELENCPVPHLHITWDDGSFDTYISQDQVVPI